MDTWTHIVVTRSGSSYKVYYNGIEQSTASGSPGDPAPTTQALRIGADIAGVGANGYFNGTIDEIRIYSRALSSTEISEHYQGVFKDETGLVGHWTFDKVEADGTVLDKSGQGNTGTLQPTYPTNCPAFIE